MKKSISIGIIALFIVTAVSPMVIGYTSVVSEQKTPDEEYAYNRFNEHYYPEGYLTGQYPTDRNDDVSLEEVIDYEDNVVTEKKHQKPQPVVTSGGPMDSPWSMFMHDVRHTGRSPYSTADNPYDEKWWFKMSGFGGGSPIIDNEGVIYTGSDELYAIYPNGTLKWKYDDWYGVIEHTAPAIDENGTIYVGLTINVFNSKDFYAFYPNGTVKWIYPVGENVFSSPAIGDDGVIYFGGGKNFYAVYLNGTLKWKYRAGDYFWGSSPAIGLDGTVYCGAHDDYVYAWYPNNGTVKWKYNTGAWVHGSATIGDDGTVYIVGGDRNLYAFYPNNGTVKWKCKIGYVWGSPTLDVDGTIYVGVFEEKFYAVYPNGTIKWTFNAGGRIWFGISAALSADGTIYFGTTPAMEGHGGDFIVLNPDGTEKMRDSFGFYESSPAIAEDGTVYIVSTHGANAYSYLRAYGLQESNSPPEPPMITGEINGTVRTEYKYTFVAIDPDNNPVSYFIDWGDARNDETRVCASGEQATVKHKYQILGKYTIRAKAKDTLGEESDWATLEVTMPKNQQMSNMLFLRWLERFPILNQIVNLLMERWI